MTSDRDGTGRKILPIPDRPYSGLVTYDAKDPDTSFPPIEPLPPAKGLQRAVVFTEIGGLALLELLWWVSYRRRHLRWRAQGAFSRWENDVIRRRPRRPGSQATGRRSRGGRSPPRG
jgi:hypothetical protein